MAIFITQGRYTADAIKGMVDNPKIVRKPSQT